MLQGALDNTAASSHSSADLDFPSRSWREGVQGAREDRSLIDRSFPALHAQQECVRTERTEVGKTEFRL